jgi:CO/xanthine dehydrogenase FAD-binding subunit
MRPFNYQRAEDVTSAVVAVSSDPGAQFLAVVCAEFMTAGDS